MERRAGGSTRASVSSPSTAALSKSKTAKQSSRKASVAHASSPASASTKTACSSRPAAVEQTPPATMLAPSPPSHELKPVKRKPTKKQQLKQGGDAACVHDDDEDGEKASGDEPSSKQVASPLSHANAASVKRKASSGGNGNSKAAASASSAVLGANTKAPARHRVPCVRSSRPSVVTKDVSTKEKSGATVAGGALRNASSSCHPGESAQATPFHTDAAEACTGADRSEGGWTTKAPGADPSSSPASCASPFTSRSPSQRSPTMASASPARGASQKRSPTNGEDGTAGGKSEPSTTAAVAASSLSLPPIARASPGPSPRGAAGPSARSAPTSLGSSTAPPLTSALGSVFEASAATKLSLASSPPPPLLRTPSPSGAPSASSALLSLSASPPQLLSASPTVAAKTAVGGDAVHPAESAERTSTAHRPSPPATRRAGPESGVAQSNKRAHVRSAAKNSSTTEKQGARAGEACGVNDDGSDSSVSEEDPSTVAATDETGGGGSVDARGLPHSPSHSDEEEEEDDDDGEDGYEDNSGPDAKVSAVAAAGKKDGLREDDTGNTEEEDHSSAEDSDGDDDEEEETATCSSADSSASDTDDDDDEDDESESGSSSSSSSSSSDRRHRRRRKHKAGKQKASLSAAPPKPRKGRRSTLTPATSSQTILTKVSREGDCNVKVLYIDASTRFSKYVREVMLRFGYEQPTDFDMYCIDQDGDHVDVDVPEDFERITARFFQEASVVGEAGDRPPQLLPPVATSTASPSTRAASTSSDQSPRDGRRASLSPSTVTAAAGVANSNRMSPGAVTAQGGAETQFAGDSGGAFPDTERSSATVLRLYVRDSHALRTRLQAQLPHSPQSAFSPSSFAHLDHTLNSAALSPPLTNCNTSFLSSPVRATPMPMLHMPILASSSGESTSAAASFQPHARQCSLIGEANGRTGTTGVSFGGRDSAEAGARETRRRSRRASVADDDEAAAEDDERGMMNTTNTTAAASALFFPNDTVADVSAQLAATQRSLIQQQLQRTVVLKDDEELQWQKMSVLGKGSFGTVYEGITKDGKLLAVKVQDIPLEEDAESTKALLSEINLMRSLKHPNIVAYYGCQTRENRETGGRQMEIFLELCHGGSLASLRKRFAKANEHFPISLVRSYTKQVLQGLAYLHASHVMHRDIKSENVLISTVGEAKLADFGCSKRIGTATASLGPPTGGALTSSTSSASTAAAAAGMYKTLVGSPFFMAPEVLKEDEAGYSYGADIWSMGCLVLELLDRSPWRLNASSTNMFQMLYQISQAKGMPTGVPTHCPPKLLSFFERCFVRDPAQRASAQELLAHEWITCPDGALEEVPPDDD